MSEHALSDADLQSFHTEGYVVVPNLFNADDLNRVSESIREVTNRALATQDYSGIMEIEPEKVEGEAVPRRILNPFEQHEAFRALATDPRLLDKVESLVGPDIALQHSKLNMKPAKVGSVVEWHQDLSYFPHTNNDVLTTLIYLDDATEENGCLVVLPRHHYHFFECSTPEGDFAGMITENLGDGRFGKPISLAAPAGSVIFMHCLTPHSSLPNRSAKGRRTLIFEYRAEDSFPIYFGPQWYADEKYVRHLRGNQAQYARFGGPAPYIPRTSKGTGSLYDMQAKNKEFGQVVAKS